MTSPSPAAILRPMELAAFLSLAQKRLADAGIENPALDARLLAAHALGLERVDLLSQGARRLTPKESEKLETLIARREKHEPVARILGCREFWGLPFALNEATLEPRPDSETLIEAALGFIKSGAFRPASPRLLDLGTGTGCLLLALLQECATATGLGIDNAPRAVEQAKNNAARLGLDPRATFAVGHWDENVKERFDIVLCNPPYIPTQDIETLHDDVRLYDPRAALDGGADGLDPYRFIIPRLPALLVPGGGAFFEVGIAQADAVAALMTSAGLYDVSIVNDLAGIPRCVWGKTTY